MSDSWGNIIVGLIILAVIITAIVLFVWVVVTFWYIALTLVCTAITVYSWERTHPLTVAKPQSPSLRILMGMALVTFVSAFAIGFVPVSWSYTLLLLVACLFSAVGRSKRWGLLYAYSFAEGAIIGALSSPYRYLVQFHGSILFLDQPLTASFVNGLIYGIPCVIFSFVSAELTTSARRAFYEEQKRRKIAAEKRRLEGERNNIENLIGETKTILENAEYNASKLRNKKYLSAIITTMTALEDFSEVFRAGQFSYADARKQILLLKDRAVTFSDIPPNEEAGADSRSSGDTRTCYEILGIEPNATIKEIMDAYRNKVQKYHPDKSGGWVKDDASLPEEIRQYLNEMFDKITKAKDECLRNASEGKSS